MRILIATLLAFVTFPALAHPGDHHEGILATLHHLFTEPDHLAMMAIVIGVGIPVLRHRSARKSESRRDSR